MFAAVPTLPRDAVSLAIVRDQPILYWTAMALLGAFCVGAMRRVRAPDVPAEDRWCHARGLLWCAGLTLSLTADYRDGLWPHVAPAVGALGAAGFLAGAVPALLAACGPRIGRLLPAGVVPSGVGVRNGVRNGWGTWWAACRAPLGWLAGTGAAAATWGVGRHLTSAHGAYWMLSRLETPAADALRAAAAAAALAVAAVIAVVNLVDAGGAEDLPWGSRSWASRLALGPGPSLRDAATLAVLGLSALALSGDPTVAATTGHALAGALGVPSEWTPAVAAALARMAIAAFAAGKAAVWIVSPDVREAALDAASVLWRGLAGARAAFTLRAPEAD